MSTRTPKSRDQKRKAKLTKRIKRQAERQAALQAKLESLWSLVVRFNPEEMRKRFEEMWSDEKIEPMSTEEILAKLSDLGIGITVDEFRENAPRFKCPCDLCSYFEERSGVDPCQLGRDGDFPWMSARVLWQRVCPELPHADRILRQIDEGYGHLETECDDEACETWFRAWEGLEKRFLADRSSVEQLDDQLFHDYSNTPEWLFDFAEHLSKLAVSNPAWRLRLIELCRTLLDRLPDSPKSFLVRIRIVLAWEYERANEPDLADAQFALAMEEETTHPHVLLEWAMVLAERQPALAAHHEQALDCVQKALAMDPIDEWDTRSQVQEIRDLIDQRRSNLQIEVRDTEHS